MSSKKSNHKNEIVYINQSSGYLMVDIINAHKENYDQKTLITGSLENENGNKNNFSVKKIEKYNRSSTLKRLVSWFVGFLQTLWNVKLYHRSSYLFIVSNPPFAPFLPLFCSNKFTLLVYDIYPDVLVEYGIFRKKSWIVKLWKQLNLKLYKRANKVYTISDGMKQRMGQYLPENNIEVIPLWANEEHLKPIAKTDNIFVRDNNLEDKFVVLYSGNLGRTHDLETLIYVAEKIQRDDILFLIIGEGDKKSKLEEMVRNKKLDNVIMKPWQPIEMLPYTLNAADLGVVTLGSGASDLSLPSKTFNYISVGVPLLCIADKKSELSNLVREYKIGKTFTPDDLEEITEFIQSYADNPKEYKAVRDNVIKASRDFSKENAKRFVEHL